MEIEGGVIDVAPSEKKTTKQSTQLEFAVSPKNENSHKYVPMVPP